MLNEKDNQLIIWADAHRFIVARFIGWFDLALTLGLVALGISLDDLVVTLCSLFPALLAIIGFAMAHSHKRRSTYIDPQKRQAVQGGVVHPLSKFEALYLRPAGKYSDTLGTTVAVEHVELGFVLGDESEDAILAVVEMFKAEKKFFDQVNLDKRDELAEALDQAAEHWEAWSRRSLSLGENHEKPARSAAWRLAEVLELPIVDLTGAEPVVDEMPASPA
jgi:hypothetical protein